MTSKAEALIKLAAETFELTESEQKLLRAVAAGKKADFSDGNEALNDLSTADKWSAERHLRASLVVWLCADKAAGEYLTHRGIRIIGAQIIEGELDLQDAYLEFPLILNRCIFLEPIQLTRAKLKVLNLAGSHVATQRKGSTPTALAINATGLQVESGVFLCNGFHATGSISLLGATIGGNLECYKGSFDGQNGDALNAQSTEIKGSVLLSDDFHATGRVSLSSATIGGNLDCKHGTFEHAGSKEYALTAMNIDVEGSMFLSEGFKSMGGVKINGATIGGGLECTNGIFGHSMY